MLVRTKISVGVAWLVVVPLALWLVAAVYLPLAGGIFNPLECWLLALLIVLLGGTSLVAHALAHLITARAFRCELPGRIPLYLHGDAAQVWPAARTPWLELQLALAGPLANLILAGAAYLVWNMQLTPALSLSMLFLLFFNSALAVINLIPAYPLDGGRLLRAICWGLLQRPAPLLGVRMGFGISILLPVWGSFLLLQRTRYSLWAGGATLALAALLLLPLYQQQAWLSDRALPVKVPRGAAHFMRVSLAVLLIGALLGLTVAMVPTNSGLELPGVSPPVEPMIEIPPEYRHPSAGSFILTTVFLQTPILAGQWLYGQLSPRAQIVPPEQVVPPDTTIREFAESNFRMLELSEKTAVAVGLTLAGYDVGISGQGVRITGVMAESRADGILQAGDVITALNGEPVHLPAELTDRLRLKQLEGSARLQIERDGHRETVVVPLLPPASEGAPPRLGVLIEPAGFDFELPFTVAIVPQKIAGGPSAGLMFALTIFDLLTAEDLTGGRIIAGTGTINLDGTVGPIGGVRQKVAGAEAAGAEYFLVPPENYEEARSAARRIKVVKIAAVKEAIRFLEN